VKASYCERANTHFTSTSPTSLVRLLASTGLPSRVTSILRTMSPPPGMIQLWNVSVDRGSGSLGEVLGQIFREWPIDPQARGFRRSASCAPPCASLPACSRPLAQHAWASFDMFEFVRSVACLTYEIPGSAWNRARPVPKT
jgi:hypothetical protein